MFDPRRAPPAHARGGDAPPRVRGRAFAGTSRAAARGDAEPELPTGEIEIVADELNVLNASRPPPFPIDDAADVTETRG